MAIIIRMATSVSCLASAGVALRVLSCGPVNESRARGYQPTCYVSSKSPKSSSAGRDDRAGRMERINLGKGKWPDDFLDALQAPSRPIAIRKPSPSSPSLSADARLLQGAFGATDLSVGASVNSSTGAFSASASLPQGSVESLLQASSLPTAVIAPPLAAVAAHRPTHRARHSVDAPLLAPKDASVFLRCDSNPDASSLGLGPSPGRVGLRRNSTRSGQRSGICAEAEQFRRGRQQQRRVRW